MTSGNCIILLNRKERIRFTRLRKLCIKNLNLCKVVATIALFALAMPLRASLPLQTWFDVSDTDLALVGGNSAIQLYPQYEPIKELITRIAKVHGVSPRLMLAIAQCESSLSASAIGDRQQSYGLFQLHIPSHPSITKEQALDPQWATDWTAKQVANGKAYMWSCFNSMLK